MSGVLSILVSTVHLQLSKKASSLHAIQQYQSHDTWQRKLKQYPNDIALLPKLIPALFH